jgi:hypothetical protein
VTESYFPISLNVLANKDCNAALITSGRCAVGKGTSLVIAIGPAIPIADVNIPIGAFSESIRGDKSLARQIASTFPTPRSKGHPFGGTERVSSALGRAYRAKYQSPDF